MQMTIKAWTALSPNEKTQAARAMTKTEWDRLFPPQPPQEFEPADASGYTSDYQVMQIWED